MIPRSRDPWQVELARAVTRPQELIDLLGLDPALLPAAVRASREFGLCVPRGFVARMAHGDPNDPLLRQVLPLAAENAPAPPGFSDDPVGERAASPRPGILHKYRGRALLIATGACAVHCRYCFRRHFPYGDHRLDACRWRESLDHLTGQSDIEEIILSGGDPLMLDDQTLTEILEGLAEVPHLRRVRIHTRLPVVLPQRVTPALCETLGSMPQRPVLVLHINHPREVDESVRQACLELKGCGTTLFNQAVLLRGVNDDAETLAALSTTLFETGVLPYYLHLLDRVRGAAHFEVPEGEAVRLLDALRERLPGYLLPRLVREVPGLPAKQPVAP